ncbi:MAG: hypothetical protein EBT08_05030 [Betaproteobacteria bacterium]|nr:hypothetical protein [Betaproteobacteria bacterium]
MTVCSALPPGAECAVGGSAQGRGPDLVANGEGHPIDRPVLRGWPHLGRRRTEIANNPSHPVEIQADETGPAVKDMVDSATQRFETLNSRDVPSVLDRVGCSPDTQGVRSNRRVLG